jgi:pilus assembly protein CpaC
MQNTSNIVGPRSAKSRPAERKLVALVLAGLALIAFTGGAAGQTVTRDAPTGPATRNGRADIISEGLDGRGRLRIDANKTAILTTRVRYKQLSIGQPEIADVNATSPTSILVTGKKQGTTQLVVWDEQDRSQMVDVEVVFDPQTLQGQFDAAFPDADIRVSTVGNGIILRGRVPNVQTAEQAVALASAYSERVLNFTEIAGGQQVMLQVRFAEVSRSATNALGVNVGFTDGRSFGASNIGQTNPFAIDGGDLATTAVNPSVTVFGRARVGDTSIDFFINALRQNNLLRVLAEPNLIAMSGQEANFLAGGEFPIPVTQSGDIGGGSAITIEYREFGVRLKMVPIVLGDGRIRLKVAPEVSDLDFTTAVRFGGFVVPGLNSRKLETTVELAEGQTFAIAGLLNNSVTATKDVTPVLGDLPVLGALFRSVRYQRKETELVVLVTPHVVQPLNPGEVPALPGEHWRDPNEFELFLNRDLGGDARAADGPATRPARATAGGPPESRKAARFHGERGFVPATADGATASTDTDNAPMGDE